MGGNSSTGPKQNGGCCGCHCLAALVLRFGWLPYARCSCNFAESGRCNWKTYQVLQDRLPEFEFRWAFRTESYWRYGSFETLYSSDFSQTVLIEIICINLNLLRAVISILILLAHLFPYVHYVITFDNDTSFISGGEMTGEDLWAYRKCSIM